MVKACVAPGCSRRQGRNDVSFYRFPSVKVRNNTENNRKRRAKWVAAVKRIVPADTSSSWKTWEPSPYDRICSAHFISDEGVS